MPGDQGGSKWTPLPERAEGVLQAGGDLWKEVATRTDHSQTRYY